MSEGTQQQQTQPAGQTADQVQDAAGGAAQQAQEATGQVQDAVGAVTDQTQQAAGQATDQAGQVVGQAQGAVGGLVGGQGQQGGQSGGQDAEEYSHSDSNATTVENDKTPKGLLNPLLNLDILPSPESETSTIESGDSGDYSGSGEGQG
jgi:hypothetical protein